MARKTALYRMNKKVYCLEKPSISKNKEYQKLQSEQFYQS